MTTRHDTQCTATGAEHGYCPSVRCSLSHDLHGAHLFMCCGPCQICGLLTLRDGLWPGPASAGRLACQRCRSERRPFVECGSCGSYGANPASQCDRCARAIVAYIG